MEAKDTVMSIPEIRELFKRYPKIKSAEDLNKMFRHLATTQAEISFKAGEETERARHDLSYCEKHNLYYCDCCPDCFLEKGRKAGRREVWDEIICPMCYRLNPHHATENNGKGCDWCQEKEDWCG